MAEPDSKTYSDRVAEQLIAALKDGTAPWVRPWKGGELVGRYPFNPTSNAAYRGINSIMLMSAGYNDPRWMTYKQARAADAQVRRGEKGTVIQYWKVREEVQATDSEGRPILDPETGKPKKFSVELERPKVFHAVVFNAEQIDGLPPLVPRTLDWDPVERAENILQNSGAQIIHKAGNRAYYSPSNDHIVLPLKEQFPSAGNYYATALHELGHWTGHSTRLDRALANSTFGSEDYAREELRAEIASFMLSAETGIDFDPGQHAAYVGSWIKALENDPAEIFRAARDAGEITKYVVGLNQTQELQRGQHVALTLEPSETAALGLAAVNVTVDAPPSSERQALEQAWATHQTLSLEQQDGRYADSKALGDAGATYRALLQTAADNPAVRNEILSASPPAVQDDMVQYLSLPTQAKERQLVELISRAREDFLARKPNDYAHAVSVAASDAPTRIAIGQFGSEGLKQDLRLIDAASLHPSAGDENISNLIAAKWCVDKAHLSLERIDRGVYGAEAEYRHVLEYAASSPDTYAAISVLGNDRMRADAERVVRDLAAARLVPASELTPEDVVKAKPDAIHLATLRTLAKQSPENWLSAYDKALEQFATVPASAAAVRDYKDPDLLADLNSRISPKPALRSEILPTQEKDRQSGATPTEIVSELKQKAAAYDDASNSANYADNDQGFYFSADDPRSPTFASFQAFQDALNATAQNPAAVDLIRREGGLLADWLSAVKDNGLVDSRPSVDPSDRGADRPTERRDDDQAQAPAEQGEGRPWPEWGWGHWKQQAEPTAEGADRPAQTATDLIQAPPTAQHADQPTDRADDQAQAQAGRVEGRATRTTQELPRPVTPARVLAAVDDYTAVAAATAAGTLTPLLVPRDRVTPTLFKMQVAMTLQQDGPATPPQVISTRFPLAKPVVATASPVPRYEDLLQGVNEAATRLTNPADDPGFKHFWGTPDEYRLALAAVHDRREEIFRSAIEEALERPSTLAAIDAEGSSALKAQVRYTQLRRDLTAATTAEKAAASVVKGVTPLDVVEGLYETANAATQKLFAGLAAAASDPATRVLIDGDQDLSAGLKEAALNGYLPKVEAARIREQTAHQPDAPYTPQERQATTTERQAAEGAADREHQHQAAEQEQRLYIDVPYKDRHEAKLLGAQWDRAKQSWHINPAHKGRFEKWISPAAVPVKPEPLQRDAAGITAATRTYIAVPFTERNEAKQCGARWDKEKTSWYVPEGVNLDLFAKWQPERAAVSQAPALDPREEFRQELERIGFDMRELPILDGQGHRARLVSDRKGEESGYYKGSVVGLPGGYGKNHRTGEEVRWVQKGITLPPEQLAAARAQAAQHRQQREAETVDGYRRVASESTFMLATLPKVLPGTQTPYLEKKGVTASAGIYRDGPTTVVPLMDTTGTVWSLQRIGDPALGGGSVKSFPKDGRKTGLFHPLGGIDRVRSAEVLILTEGYATGTSVRDGARDDKRVAVIAAMDAGNMVNVAKELRAAFPDKAIILAADSVSIQKAGKVNTVGVDKAHQAAAAVGGTVIVPYFSHPDPMVAKLTDFNDAANENPEGRASVERQVQAGIAIALAHEAARKANLNQPNVLERRAMDERPHRVQRHEEPKKHGQRR